MSTKSNNKIYLSNIFIRLNVHDLVTLATVRVAKAKEMRIVMKYLDESVLGKVFFAYELIEMDKYNSCDLLEEKSRRFYNLQQLQRYLEEEQMLILENLQPVSIGSLYKKMSHQTIRVSNRIFFDRMKFDTYKIKTVKNIFFRLFLTKNILCLSSLANQLKYLQQKQTILQSQQQLLDLLDQQKKIQLYLDGQYYIDMQIYMPSRLRNILYFVIDESEENKDLVQEYIKLARLRDQVFENQVDYMMNRQKDRKQQVEMIKMMQKLKIKEKKGGELQVSVIQES